MPEDIVEGWTEPMDFQLTIRSTPDAAAVPLDLTGMTVTSQARDKNGAAVPLNGTTSVVDAATGKVRYSPSGTEFTKALSPYGFRFKVVDGTLKVAFFPNAGADIWTVRL